ncbi:MAG: hypothetical protein ACYS1A_15265 [Planctomycetota bacterium]
MERIYWIEKVVAAWGSSRIVEVESLESRVVRVGRCRVVGVVVCGCV